MSHESLLSKYDTDFRACARKAKRGALVELVAGGEISLRRAHSRQIGWFGFIIVFNVVLPQYIIASLNDEHLAKCCRMQLHLYFS